MSRAGCALFAAGLALLGCTRAWKADESARIDEITCRDPLDPESSAARGIALHGAPPLAPPWRPGEGYQLGGGSGRKTRLGKTRSDPPRIREDRGQPTRAKARGRKARNNAHAR